MRKFCLSLIVASATLATKLIRSGAFFAAIAAAPLSGGVSGALPQISVQQGSIPDASSGMPPRLGIDNHAQDPATQIANAKRFKELNILRQKEMTSDAAKLVQLAAELKTNLDKREQGASSPDLLHKAEQIEKLARSVRTRMTDAIGGERPAP